MRALPLKQRIFKLLGGLVAMLAVAFIVVQWYATSDYAKKQIRSDLALGEQVIREVFANREKLLFNAADVLTSDFGFKAAIASGDVPTMNSALANQRERIAADLMAALNLNGEVVAQDGLSHPYFKPFMLPGLLRQQVQHDGGAISFLLVDGKLYQAIILLTSAPDPIGLTLVGFEVDQELLHQVKSIINLDILMRVRSDTHNLTISSLSGDVLVQAEGGLSPESTSLHLSQTNWVSTSFPYDSGNPSLTIEVALTDQLARWHADFRLLLQETIAIAVLVLVIALGLGLWFAGNLSQPLAALVGRANRIAEGDYTAAEPVISLSEEINRLSQAIEVMQQGIQQRENTIQYQANHDELTGLSSRAQICRMIEERLQSGESFQAVGMKASGFREVNAAFGLQAGDACMVSLAERLKRLGGVAARLNGNELLWLPGSNITEAQLRTTLAELEAPHAMGEIELTIKLAGGLVELPEHADTASKVLRYASVATDAAQKLNPRVMKYSEGMEEARIKRIAVLRELEKALQIDSPELQLFYQPKLDLHTGGIAKVEALMRWNSSVLGFVPPDEFIPIAERAGLINKVTRWVVRRAISDCRVCVENGLDIKLAINLSVHDVANTVLMKEIEQSLQDAGLGQDSLEFEITESDLMSEPGKAINLLQSFRDKGFGLAIDDFGTGYSSLAYLKSLPVTELKIDKSFVLKLSQDEGDQTIVRSIIDLAKRFDLKVVAEGVETESALKLLQDWGCDWAQGYHISRPVSLSDLIEWLSVNEEPKWLA